VAPDISEADLATMFTALDVDNTGSVDAQVGPRGAVGSGG
jgi:hypothetical protein